MKAKTLKPKPNFWNSKLWITLTTCQCHDSIFDPKDMKRRCMAQIGASIVTRSLFLERWNDAWSFAANFSAGLKGLLLNEVNRVKSTTGNPEFLMGNTVRWLRSMDEHCSELRPMIDNRRTALILKNCLKYWLSSEFEGQTIDRSGLFTTSTASPDGWKLKSDCRELMLGKESLSRIKVIHVCLSLFPPSISTTPNPGICAIESLFSQLMKLNSEGEERRL